MIENNLYTINERIEVASKLAGRNKEDITLLAVSKTKSNEAILDTYHLGLRSFGENKVQELVEKYHTLPKDINWHMIGHLQRNKVKYIAPFISCIHSVDSTRLAETINKEGIKNNRVISILIEINMANEESKFGIKPCELAEFLEYIKTLTNVRVDGLMTIAPNPSDPENNRVYFNDLYKLFVDNQAKKSDNVSMNVLSMGMSKDYMIAIQEGATIIRIGSDLFGSRS